MVLVSKASSWTIGLGQSKPNAAPCVPAGSLVGLVSVTLLGLGYTSNTAKRRLRWRLARQVTCLQAQQGGIACVAVFLAGNVVTVGCFHCRAHVTAMQVS